MQAAFGKSAAPILTRKAGHRRTATVESQPTGKGWPKVKDYHVKDLISWWRFQWRKHFPKVEPPDFYWKKMYGNLLSWLKAEDAEVHGKGWKIVEDIVEFVFASWKTLQNRIDSLSDADGPSLPIIFGYRVRFKREMGRMLNQETKKWVAPARKATDEEATTGYRSEVCGAI